MWRTVWESMRSPSSALTGCRVKLFMKSFNIVSRMIGAASVASGMGKVAVADRIVAAGRVAAGRVVGGLLDLRRAMTGRRVMKMTLCG